MEGEPLRMGLATPLIDGMVVSRRVLGTLVRQTSLNMARRKRLENESYQPPHVKRKLKVQETMSKFPCTFTAPEFYSCFIGNSRRCVMDYGCTTESSLKALHAIYYTTTSTTPINLKFMSTSGNGSSGEVIFQIQRTCSEIKEKNYNNAAMSGENNNHTLYNRDMKTCHLKQLDVTASGRQEGDRSGTKGLNKDVDIEEYAEEYLDISEFLMIQIDEEDSSFPVANSRLGSRRKAPVAATASHSDTMLKRIHLSNNRDGSPRTPIQPFRQPPLTKSALLQQLQTPVNSKPNILKKSSQPYTTPLPFVQPRPNINFPSPMPSSSQKEISLEKHVTSSCNPLQQSTNNLTLYGSNFQFMAGQNSMFGKIPIPQMSQPQQGPYYGIHQQTYPMTQILPMHDISSSLQMIVLPTGYGQEFSPSVFGGCLYQQQNLNFSPLTVPTHWCTVCCQTFWSMQSSQAHSLTHDADFNSRASSRGLLSWKKLEQHEATHKRHKCQLCKKAFRFSGNLRAHERTHTGERPYKCADCPKDYKQLGGLQYHLKANPTHRAQKYKLEDQS